jgi:hypothetical protein
MSLVQRLITAAYQGGKGALKGGKGSVDDILRSTPLGGAPVRRSVGTIDSVRPMTGRFSGVRLPGTSPAAMNNNAGIRQSAPQVPRTLEKTIFGTPPFRETIFGRSNPIVGNTPIVTKGANKNLIQQASQYMPKGPMGFLGRGFQVFEGAQVVDNLRKGNYGQAVVNAALMFPGKTLSAVKGLLPAGGLGVAGLTGLGLAGLELGAPATVADGTLDSPEAKKANEIYDRLTKDTRPEQGADLDMDAIRNLPGGANNPLPPFNPNQDLPASAEQSVDPTPFQHQMAIYEQGRNAAQTQAERNQVRDLGLAIHKAHNPQLYSNFQVPMASDRTFNPLMANTFPDSYPQTREAFIAEGGVQLPQTMNNVDARNELVEGNRLEGERAAGELASSLEAQEFMKKFLAGRAGGK